MKAILFDMEGVLIEPVDSRWISFNETLEKFGKRRISKREYMGEYYSLNDRANLGKFGLGDDAVKYLRERYMSNTKKIKVVPGARKTLKSLSKKLKLGLITNTPAEFVYKILEFFELKKYFDVIITRYDVKKVKPDPEMVIKACNSLGLDESEVVVVGDAKNDVLAGKSAGCTVVGLNVESDFKIKKLSELLKFVEQSF